MDDLITWLRAQLDADERGTAYAHCDGCEGDSGCDVDDARRRVLAEVDAKRRIVDLHRPVRKRSTGSDGGTSEDCQMCDHFPAQYPCATMRALALPYADRPGCREDWRP